MILLERSDSKDDFLINLSVDGEADYIITGDSDLLELKNYGECKFIKYKDFIDIMNGWIAHKVKS